MNGYPSPDLAQERPARIAEHHPDARLALRGIHERPFVPHDILPRPTTLTLQQLSESYRVIGVPTRVAVRYIVDSRLRIATAYGHGNRAARRQARLQAAFEAREDKAALLTVQDVADLAERYSESRTFPQLHVNIHD